MTRPLKNNRKKVGGKVAEIYNPKTSCRYKLSQRTGTKHRRGQIIGVTDC